MSVITDVVPLPGIDTTGSPPCEMLTTPPLRQCGTPATFRVIMSCGRCGAQKAFLCAQHHRDTLMGLTWCLRCCRGVTITAELLSDYRREEKKEMITEADMAWVAGILDCKGHVISKNNPQRARNSAQIVITVRTVDHAIAERLCALTGTSPDFCEQTPVSGDFLRRECSEHCPEAHTHYRMQGLSPVATWTLTNGSAAILLRNAHPQMATFHSGGEPWGWAMGMAFASTRLSGPGARAAADAIRRMHRLGWELPPLMRDCAPRELEAAR